VLNTNICRKYYIELITKYLYIMAAIQSIRNRGVLLVAVIAVALFLFVIGDALRGGESIWNQSKMNVGQIGGEKVSIQDYQDMVEDFTVFYEIQKGQSSFSEEENNRIKDEAWQTYVQNTLVANECEKLGIKVTDDEVAEAVQSGAQILNVPIFQNQQTGRYDYATVQQFLSEYQKAKESGQQIPDGYNKIYQYYIFAQKQIRAQLLSQKYQVLLYSSILSNKLEAKASFDERNKESDILLAAVPFTTVDDKEIEVSDADAKAKYDAEKEQYRQYIETRDIKVLDVYVQPSAEDKAATEKEMDENYSKLLEAGNNTAAANAVRQAASLMPYTDILKTKDAFPAFISNALDSITVGTTLRPSFDASQNIYFTAKLLNKATRPDSILFRQIVVSGTEDADIAKKTDSIMNAIKSGADFKTLAKKYNQKGDSTWLASSQYEMAQLDADNTLFVSTLSEMAAGQAKSVKLTGGTIILQVMETRKPVTKYNVATIVKELRFSDETYKTEYNKFSSFIASNTTIEQIEENAAKSGYAIRPINDINSSSHNIAGIHGTREAIKWVFDEAKVGDISQLYECGNNDHLMLVSLAGINKEGYRSFEKVKDDITAEVKNEKKAEKLLSTLSSVSTWEAAKSAKGVITDTIRHITFNAPSFVKATNSSEPIVSAMAYKTSKGQFAGPVKGNAGVYMIKVLDSKRFGDKFEAKTEQETTSGQNFRYISSTVMQTLYLNANVKDQRYKFF